MSFGAWQSKDEDATAPQNTEVDRYPNVSPGARNSHTIAPYVATIEQGGTVNFVISGLHQVIVYAPGKTPEDVLSGVTRPTTGTPAGVLINDAERRVFAGFDPSTQARDPDPAGAARQLEDRAVAGEPIAFCLPRRLRHEYEPVAKQLQEDLTGLRRSTL